MPTKIEWADESWNPITGCTPISDGCKNCYAKRMAQRLKGRAGYPLDDPFRVTFHPDRLDQPLKWKKPRRIFVVSMGDLFHEDVEDWQLDRIFDRVFDDSLSRHTFMILTKRPERMRDYIQSVGFVRDNVWLGVTAENQAMADERIPILLQIPAAKRFLSLEPLLGPVDIKPFIQLWDDNGTPEFLEKHGWWYNDYSGGFAGPGAEDSIYDPKSGIDLVIAGGESGPKARPSHPDWFRKVRDDCAAADVEFMFKQWGEWGLHLASESKNSDFGVLSPDGTWYHKHTGWNGRPIDPDTGEAFMVRYGKKAAGRELDGQIHDGWPGE